MSDTNQNTPEASFTTLAGGTPRVEFTPPGRTQAAEQARDQKSIAASGKVHITDHSIERNYASVNMADHGNAPAGTVTNVRRAMTRTEQGAVAVDYLTIDGIEVEAAWALSEGLVSRLPNGKYVSTSGGTSLGK